MILELVNISSVLLSISGNPLNVDYVLIASKQTKHPKSVFFFVLACLFNHSKLWISR